MEDSAIIDLYWAREERALSETDAKYGGYCRSIAHNILKNREGRPSFVGSLKKCMYLRQTVMI